jgi:hypothetical protein
MMRRVVSLFAVLGILANQLAEAPHAHAGMPAVERRQHDAHRHFHVEHGAVSEQGKPGDQGCPHSHSGGHRHAAAAHQHNQHDERKQHDQRQPAPADRPAGDHDADAIYLPFGCASVIAFGDDGAAATSNATVVDPSSPGFFRVKVGGNVPPFWESASANSSARPRYLQLRTLRI